MNDAHERPLTDVDQILASAAGHAGLDLTDAHLLRDGSNTMYVLPAEQLVARVGRPGRADSSLREVAVARWLATVGVPVNQPAEIEPVTHEDRAITWWLLLQSPRHATTGELGHLLRELHRCEVPTDIPLPVFDPLEGMLRRTVDSPALEDPDRGWLMDRLAQLREELAAVPAEPQVVLHGDAWQGNALAEADQGAVLIDFENVSIGHPDWDEIPVAVDYADFARLSRLDYDAFASAYGRDITVNPWFRAMADVQEIRWTLYVATKASTDPEASKELHHRLRCLRGEQSRPWVWNAF